MTECYVDTMVANVALDASDKCRVRHSHSCTKICSTMDGQFADKFAVGIIDADKRQPKYVEQFDVIDSTSTIQ